MTTAAPTPSSPTPTPTPSGATAAAAAGSRAHTRWSDLSPRRRAATVAGGIVQFALLAAALIDLRRRDPAEVNGPRWVWALVSLVNFVGPLTYFAFGRHPRDDRA